MVRDRIRAGGVVAALVVAVAACGGDGDADGGGDAVARGQQLFDNNCAVCHGEAGTGTADGPPLVHVIYEPNHHPDETFHRAVDQGVPAHHWDFGDMPPVPGLDSDEIDAIIEYVRERQQEAGIT